MFQALNQLLSFLPLVKAFDTVNAHMTVILPKIGRWRRAHWAIRTHMTFGWDLTDTALVESSALWNLLCEQRADDIIRIETGTQPTCLFGINPLLCLGLVYQLGVRCFLTRTRLTFILADERTAPLLPCLGCNFNCIIVNVYLCTIYRTESVER